MMLILKLAWRNVFRNARRTILAGLAIGVGLACLILADAVVTGMEENMIRMATDTLLGQGQIHRQGFRKTLEVEKTIVNGQEVLANLEKEPAIKVFAPRVLSVAMVTSTANVSSIMLYGIDAEMEKGVSSVDDVITQGRFLNGEDTNKIVLGEKLARVLEADLGDRLVLTVAQAETGDLSQEMFRVAGIFQFNIREIDGHMAFVPIEKAQEMLGLPGQFHEIAFHFADINQSRNRSLAFWSDYSENGNIAEGWMDIMSELESLLELTQFSILITAGILFAIVSLGIMNTLFMSLYERMFEFGVLRAIGTRPFKMAYLIIFEAGAIALISIAIGYVLGLAVTGYFSFVGIDYTGLEFGGLTFRDKLYPVMTLKQFTIYPIWLFVFTLIVGIYPGIYAARLKPARAMKKSF